MSTNEETRINSGDLIRCNGYEETVRRLKILCPRGRASSSLAAPTTSLQDVSQPPSGFFAPFVVLLPRRRECLARGESGNADVELRGVSLDVGGRAR